MARPAPTTDSSMAPPGPAMGSRPPPPSTMPTLTQFEERLGYQFRDSRHLQLALTHPSIAHELGAGSQHNQRLEFLGDSVIQLALTTELYQRFPGYGEGPLSKARAQLVNRITLAEQGHRLRLGEHLILSRGEETSGGRTRQSTVADAFEAIIGAVFLDAGYDATRDLLLRLFAESFSEIGGLPNLDNPKGELQERLQATSPAPPSYELVATSGPDHDRSFECAVFHCGVELARGTGRSKKHAESAAALEALRKLSAGTAAPARHPGLPSPGEPD